MSLEDELGAAAEAVRAFAGPGEEVSGIVVAEPVAGVRVYLCAFRAGERLAWLALDAGREPVADRMLLREAVTIVGLCELAEESAGGGDLDELRARLAELRETERPLGIEEAERAAADLAGAISPPPRVASPEYLDLLGAAAARLERALGELVSSPFARALAAGAGAVEALAKDVEAGYKRPLG